MPHILVVCTANICRSPVVTALLQQRLNGHGRTGWTVESAGTWATIARGAARYSIQLMAAQNIDISQHQARMINEEMIKQADLILGMESGHVEALQVEFPSHRKRIFTLSQMAGKSYSVADPYGGTLKDYQDMVAEVTRLIDVGFSRIVALAEKNAQQRSAG